MVGVARSLGTPLESVADVKSFLSSNNVTLPGNMIPMAFTGESVSERYATMIEALQQLPDVPVDEAKHTRRGRALLRDAGVTDTPMPVKQRQHDDATNDDVMADGKPAKPKQDNSVIDAAQSGTDNADGTVAFQLSHETSLADSAKPSRRFDPRPSPVHMLNQHVEMPAVLVEQTRRLMAGAVSPLVLGV